MNINSDTSAVTEKQPKNVVVSKCPFWSHFSHLLSNCLLKNIRINNHFFTYFHTRRVPSSLFIRAALKIREEVMFDQSTDGAESLISIIFMQISVNAP